MYLLLSIPFPDANSSLTQSANGGAESSIFISDMFRYVSSLSYTHSHLLFGASSNSNAGGNEIDVALDA